MDAACEGQALLPQQLVQLVLLADGLPACSAPAAAHLATCRFATSHRPPATPHHPAALQLPACSKPAAAHLASAASRPRNRPPTPPPRQIYPTTRPLYPPSTLHCAAACVFCIGCGASVIHGVQALFNPHPLENMALSLGGARRTQPPHAQQHSTTARTAARSPWNMCASLRLQGRSCLSVPPGMRTIWGCWCARACCGPANPCLAYRGSDCCGPPPPPTHTYTHTPPPPHTLTPPTPTPHPTPRVQCCWGPPCWKHTRCRCGCTLCCAALCHAAHCAAPCLLKQARGGLVAYGGQAAAAAGARGWHVSCLRFLPRPQPLLFAPCHPTPPPSLPPFPPVSTGRLQNGQEQRRGAAHGGVAVHPPRARPDHSW